jgi:hypothetical protein
MKKRAMQMLAKTENGEYTQALVLYSKSGAEYSAIIKNACTVDMVSEKDIIEELKLCNDTAIQYLLCMWADNCIDIPSFAFRKMLCEINPENSEACLFVTAMDGVRAIKLSKTMK